VLVEATLPASDGVELLGVEPVEWAGLPAFRFVERWPEGSAEALVVQGPDRWLYLLRVRGLRGETIPPLLWDIQASFRLEQDRSDTSRYRMMIGVPTLQSLWM